MSNVPFGTLKSKIKVNPFEAGRKDTIEYQKYIIYIKKYRPKLSKSKSLA